MPERRWNASPRGTYPTARIAVHPRCSERPAPPSVPRHNTLRMKGNSMDAAERIGLNTAMIVVGLTLCAACLIAFQITGHSPARISLAGIILLAAAAFLPSLHGDGSPDQARSSVCLRPSYSCSTVDCLI